MSRPRQLNLFPRSKPLSERFGRDFFLSIPRAPGVYFMYDAADKLLYIGQSCDLRDRLNSYRHIHPDRDARRTWRLVHLVRRIEWRVTATAEEAITTERDLLLAHRPRFNRASVWPSPNWFIEVTADRSTIALRILGGAEPAVNVPTAPDDSNFPGVCAPVAPKPPSDGGSTCAETPELSQIQSSNQPVTLNDHPLPFLCDSAGSAGTVPSLPLDRDPLRFGPFNSGLRYLFPTLLRLLFFSLAKPSQFSEVPHKLLKNRNLEHHVFALSTDNPYSDFLTDSLRKFLTLESDDLIRQFETQIQSTPTLSPFEKTYWTTELETLQEFYDARTDHPNDSTANERQ